MNKLKEATSKENFLGATIDLPNKQIRVYTNDMLTKRYTRDSKRIAETFDVLCDSEMKILNELYSKCICRISDGFLRATVNKDEFAMECGKLLMNATKTIQASVELLRTGYILQPSMLIRSTVEVFSLIAYMKIKPQGYNEFKNGEVNINKTIAYGKEIVPLLGLFQGLLSNNFVHISDLHTEFNNINEYTEMDGPLELNLNIIHTAIWLTDTISELIFYEYFEEHEFWKHKSGREYEYKFDENNLKWMEF